ncbi:MAG: hypothetical protein ABL982_11715 [Vicinamibacterales bacterium]
MKVHTQLIVAAVMFVLCVALASVADTVVGQVRAWVAASTDSAVPRAPRRPVG